MLILQEHDGQNGRFYIEDNNEEVAAIEYTLSNEKTLFINHTEVDERLQGNQIGVQLVEKVADFAREKHFTIVPICSYVAAIMKRETRFADVLG